MNTLSLSCEAANLKEHVDEAMLFLKKISNPDRLLICCALADGECSVRHLEELLNIRQPGLSQQLSELRQASLIAGRKDGKRVFYRIADERVRMFIGLMHDMFGDRPSKIPGRRRAQMAALGQGPA